MLDPNISLTPIQGKSRSLSDWVTNFHLVLVVVDPFRHESSWILNSAQRILKTFSQADCRVAWLATGTKEDAQRFLGPLAKEFLTFLDPEREAITSFGIQSLPAILHINHTPEIVSAAEGWNPDQWRQTIQGLAKAMSWKAPTLPQPGDPVPFQGTPALI